jgi:hypothetical protein
MPLKVKKVTIPTIAASVLFNGSNQYLSLPNTSTMQMGTSDYTVEAWIYPTANGQANTSQIFAQSAAGVSSQFIVGLTSANKIVNYIEYAAGGGSAGPVITSATSITLNTWTHIATARVSGVTRIFINGVLDASASDAGGYRVVSHNFSIGSQNGAGSTFFTGYISNLRVIKGTGLYASNFTPTRATLTAVTNTSLLTCHDTTIRDASTNNFTITNNNTATVSTVSPFTVLRSVSFNGSNQYLSIANNAAFNFGTGSFTIEWWQYLNSAFAGSTGIPIGQKTSDATNGWQIYRNTSVNTDKISVRFGGTDYVTTVTPSSQVWEHWALVRDNGSTLTWYRNGTACGVYSSVTSNISDSGNMNIGYAQTWGYTAASSSISNFRILKGTALYTASFTPAGPLTAITSCSLLTCNDQTIRDASTNNFTITNNNTATVSTVTPFTAVLPSSMKFKRTNTGTAGNSVQFDGVNDYLSLSNSAAFNFGTGDLTIEFWIYFTGTNQSRVITSRMTTGGASGTWSVTMNNTYLSFTEVVSGEPGPSATFSSILNTWAHIAVSRNSGTTKLFLNGSQLASAAQTTNFSNTSYPVYIATSPSESYIPAYISNLRVLKGTGLYAASFSVPTSPLTAIANTSLLTCNAATIIDGSSNNFTITNNNGATVSSAVVPFTPMVGGFRVKKSAGVYMVATGGDLITTSGSYKIHTFTTVGTSSFTINSVGSTPSIEYLIVGGGGAGGSNNNCGGGGAGGLIYNTASLSVGAYAITIGQSGSVASGVSNGNNGGNSTFNGLIALGGGGGGGSTAGSNGGSGGGNGGGGFGGTDSGGGAGLQATSSYGGFGNKGGFSAGASSYPGGGGGGAGAAGNNGSGATGGNGGIGKAYAFAGALTYYAGGGGGSLNPGTAGTGGLGGGGNGRSTIGVGIAATGYGSGGGGGLSAGSGGEGGAGSPGIILIKYRYTD